MNANDYSLVIRWWTLGATGGSIPARLAGSSNLKPPGSGRDSVNAVLAQAHPGLHPHCDRPRFSIRCRLFLRTMKETMSLVRPFASSRVPGGAPAFENPDTQVSVSAIATSDWMNL